MKANSYDIRPLFQMAGSRHSHHHLQAAWEVLDRFARSLPSESETTGQVIQSLEAVREALKADVVYWDPGPGSESTLSIGRSDVSSSWCRSLTSRMIRLMEDEDEDGQILRTHMPAECLAISPPLISVAMVRVSRSMQSWIVAASCTPGWHFRGTDLKIMSLARRLLLNQRHNMRMHGNLRETLFGLVRCLTAVIEAKDPYTCGHSERVARIAQRLGCAMGLSEPELGDIYLAGLLHDIGKVGIRDDILRKPGALTAEEIEHVRQHTVIGDRLISSIRPLEHLRPGVRNHHERYDGLGYPEGLAGEQIPLMSRVLAIADACDAMMSDRPYRKALPTSRIEAIIHQGAGKEWDPAIVEHFMLCRHDLYPILQRGLGESVAAAVEQAIHIHRDAVSVIAPRRR